jgi:lipopolysaccharide transport system ATP-binding protein
MLNGLIKPDRGSITMRGRVGALIALGAGFNPILTGRENIYINGSVLGLTKKEIDAKINEIIDFAEIREFIDMPVQSYSSGMAVRLGFSVATAMHPDVLILDEVLAVGDAAFRNKCYKRIGAIKKTTAVIFVSHNMEQVGRICELAILLREGSVLCNGPAEKAIQQYELLCSHKDIKGEGFLKHSDMVQHLEIIPQKVEIICGEEWLVKVSVGLSPEAKPGIFRAVFYSSSGEWVADAVATWPSRNGFKQNPAECVFKVSSVTLRNGIYRMSFHIIDESGTIIAWAHKMHDIKITGASKYNAAVSVLSAVLEN